MRVPRKLTLPLAVAAGLYLMPSTSAANDRDIQEIRRQYAQTNRNLSTYRKIERELVGYSLEGGSLEAYFAGSALRKMVVTHYGEGGQTIEEYYFRAGRLVFVYAALSQYNKPFGKIARTEENRFYFKNGRLIRWLDEQRRSVSVKEARAREREQKVLASTREMMGLIHTPSERARPWPP